MKTAAIGTTLLLIATGSLFVQKAASFSALNGDILTSEFTGEIMDSICAEEGHHIGVVKSNKNTSKANCTLACVKLSDAKFVLYEPKLGRTYKLDDQQQPEAFAGQKVIVTGTYDKEKNTLRVTRIRRVIETAL